MVCKLAGVDTLLVIGEFGTDGSLSFIVSFFREGFVIPGSDFITLCICEDFNIIIGSYF